MKYKFVNLDGRTASFRATSFIDVLDLVAEIENHKDAGWTFFIDDSECSIEDMVLHASIKDANRIAKRKETHKQIKVSQGATTLANTYRTIWVKR